MAGCLVRMSGEWLEKEAAVLDYKWLRCLHLGSATDLGLPLTCSRG